MSVEQWRPVACAPGYEVSDHGNIRSWRSRHGITAKPHPRAPFKRDDGYMIVTFMVDGRRISRTIHSLVAETFLGPKPEGLQVRHLDGNPGNNHVGNLRYGTQAENEADKVRHGTAARPWLSKPRSKRKAA